MAFFKFRQSGDSPSPSNRPTESIEVMRQRAKHRLIGSVVLVLAGVVGFPLLFDTQPRPMPVDVQIEIPDKNKVAPLTLPSSAVTMPVAEPAPAVVAPSAVSKRATPTHESAKVAAASSLDAKEQLVVPDTPKNKPKVVVNTAVVASENGADEVPSAIGAPKTLPKVKVEPKAEHKVDKKAEEASRAKALLEGKEPPAKSHDDSGRYIIQVGAFAEAGKAQEVRMKLERAGLKTYTHVAETKDGPRTRVRLGPFTSKADSDKAAAKVKSLGLPAAMLTL